MATASTSPPSQGLADTGFLGNILTPGSSLHPTFLLILDGAFALLLCVFLGLLVLTRGNVHIFALIGIEGCLWASIKWWALPSCVCACAAVTNNIDARFISELQKSPDDNAGDTQKTKDE